VKVDGRLSLSSYLCSVKQRTRRHISAVVLLAIYLSVLLLSSVHLHPETALGMDACEQCVHHLPHGGHLSAGNGTAHDCLLCQFLSISYVAVAVAAVVFFANFRKLRYIASRPSDMLVVRGFVALRAPPSLFL
jgi:hypothetical protein